MKKIYKVYNKKTMNFKISIFLLLLKEKDREKHRDLNNFILE